MPLSPVPNKFRQVPVTHELPVLTGITKSHYSFQAITTGYKLQQLHRAIGEKLGNEVVEEWRDIPIHAEATPCNPPPAGL